MVKEETRNGKTYYQCEICKFYYKEKKWAEKCEAWCDEKHSCNIDVVKYAVNLDEEQTKENCCS